MFLKISFFLGIKGFSIFDSDEIDDLEEKIGKMVERGAKKSFSNSFWKKNNFDIYFTKFIKIS